MLIGTTMLQQVLTAVAIFVVSVLLLAFVQALLAGSQVATGLGYLRFLCPMFLMVGVLWIALAVAVRLLI